jgi:predicted Fe-Mo cluster-binding NifX family protein
VRIALTIHDGRIAPVFESARRLLVVDIPAAGSRHKVSLAGESVLDRVRQVAETGADELVCGGITGPMRHMLEARGIRVRPWVALDVETALRLVAERSRAPMKIIVSAVDPGPDARVEPRFGRAPWYVAYDPESGQYESFENPYLDRQSGAGIQAAQLVLDRKAGAIITGRCGPNAFGTLSAAGVTVYGGAGGTVREAVEAQLAGRLEPTGAPSSPGHVGMPASTGRGGGQGVGPGGGRGRGQGRGQGGGQGRGPGRGQGRGPGGGQGGGGGRRGGR